MSWMKQMESTYEPDLDYLSTLVSEADLRPCRRPHQSVCFAPGTIERKKVPIGIYSSFDSQH